MANDGVRRGARPGSIGVIRSVAEESGAMWMFSGSVLACARARKRAGGLARQGATEHQGLVGPPFEVRTGLVEDAIEEQPVVPFDDAADAVVVDCLEHGVATGDALV